MKWMGGMGAAALVLALTSPGEAQVMASEKASVSQTIDGTKISVEYSRPSLRGRDARADLFGEQIGWGLVWTPGANQATVLEVSKTIRLSGVEVPSGRWSVWMVVGEDDWELVLDPRDDLYHVAHPEPSEDQIRFPIAPHRGLGSVETLLWSFPAVRRDGADLRMQWGDVAVDLLVEVEPTVDVALTAEAAAGYLGPWTVEQMPMSWTEGHTFDLELRRDGELLMGTLAFTPDNPTDFAFVPVADQVFKLGLVMNGDVAEVMEWAFVEFVVDEDGTAASFELRDADDELYMRGERAR